MPNMKVMDQKLYKERPSDHLRTSNSKMGLGQILPKKRVVVVKTDVRFNMLKQPNTPLKRRSD